MSNLMYSPLETVFESTMQREGRTVTAYTSGSEFQAFMRRNDDGNNFEDRITLYYAVDAPVTQGSIISCANKLYILVNQESEENTCYYKSSGLACNGMITLNDGTITGVPCYGYNMNSALVKQNNVMSIISGNMEFITESSSASQQIALGNTFNEFGRTFKVDNIYHKDGILHIVSEVTMNEDPLENLSMIIDGLTEASYTIGSSAKLEASLYVNGTVTTGTITWTSTNNNIATIDGGGDISFVSDGTVSFKAYWIEKNKTEVSDTVTVGLVIPPPHGHTVTINGSDTIIIGMSRGYTAHLFNDLKEQINGTWNFDTNFNYPDSLTIKQNGNKLTIDVLDDTDLLAEKLVIVATETTKNISVIKDVMIKGLWT